MSTTGMKRVLALLAAATCLPAPVTAAGADTGRDIAAACLSCHRGDHRGDAAIPDLAGMDESAIVQRVQAFRDGRRPSTIMQQLARGYTDAQIEAAAAYLAAARGPR
ncbi:MAG: c-type cytochrome [Casimicrobiaceae bacterium]